MHAIDTTTTATDHGATVASIYDAFGRGDVPTITAQLDEHVAWDQQLRHGARRRPVTTHRRDITTSTTGPLRTILTSRFSVWPASRTSTFPML